MSCSLTPTTLGELLSLSMKTGIEFPVDLFKEICKAQLECKRVGLNHIVKEEHALRFYEIVVKDPRFEEFMKNMK
jgi:hypothetical protein